VTRPAAPDAALERRAVAAPDVKAVPAKRLSRQVRPNNTVAATAARIAGLSPGEGYQAQAKLAEKRKEYATAEMELRRAVETAPQTVGRFIRWPA